MRSRIYITNDSFPELREMPLGWRRSATWMRAIAHASRDVRFWAFAAAQLAVVLAAVSFPLSSDGATVTWFWIAVACGLALLALSGYLQVSWGGDIMRSHLRAVNDIARHACPSCGHDLRGHLDEGDAPITCSECGESISRDVFVPPFPIPREFRAFPPWSA